MISFERLEDEAVSFAVSEKLNLSSLGKKRFVKFTLIKTEVSTVFHFEYDVYKLSLNITQYRQITRWVLVCAQILYARDIDQRSSTFEKSLAMGLAFQRRTKVSSQMICVLLFYLHRTS